MSLVTFLAQRTCATCLKQGVGEVPGSKADVQVKQGPVRGATTTSKAPYGQCLTYPTYLVDPFHAIPQLQRQDILCSFPKRKSPSAYLENLQKSDSQLWSGACSSVAQI